MTLLSRAELQALTQMSREPCVSIYLPTHEAGPQTRQDPIRLKNLIGQAQERLVAEASWTETEAEAMLQPVTMLLEQPDFWQHQQQGLAIFCKPDFFQTYRLPLSFEALVVVTHRFHIKPLIRLLTNETEFLILAISQNQLRLFQATQYTIHAMDLDDVPQSLAEALQYDDPEKQLQFHSGNSADSTPMYHGHGVGTTDNKDEILRYFQKVEGGLQPLLWDHQIPLVFAGVDYLFPIYQQANSYPLLLEDCVSGNPDQLKPTELHQQAWPIAHSYFQKTQQQAIAQYQDQTETNLTSADLTNIVLAAHEGQVETLFVTQGTQQWGKFDLQTRKVETHSSESPQNFDEDLLDLATVQTWLQGGHVYVLEPEQMPTDASLAAVLRYPLPQAVS